MKKQQLPLLISFLMLAPILLSSHIYFLSFQSRMMLTGSSVSPFAAVESAVYKTLFAGYSPYAALTGEVQESCTDAGTTRRTSSSAKTKESSGNGAAGKRTPAPPVKGQSNSLKAKQESENAGTADCKKSN